MNISIPGRGLYKIDHAALDMNGTIAVDGRLLEGVAERLVQLRSTTHLVIITADTHGGASRLSKELGIETIVLDEGNEAEQKLDLVRNLGADRSVAIGNGANDVLMLKESAIGICILGPEGASAAAFLAADVLVGDVRDALDLLLNPLRLVATLRR